MTHRWHTATVFAAFIVTGFVSGLWSHRWVSALDAGRARLTARLPNQVGEWDGKDVPRPPGELNATRADAICQSSYVHRTNGRAAAAMLMCGRPGPIAVHTPDVCYPGAGYRQVGPRKIIDVPGASGAQFALLRFQKDGPAAIPLNVYFAWNDGDGWRVPDNPRIAFAGKPALFKLYVTSECEVGADAAAADLPTELIRDLLPLLKLND